MEDKYPYRVFDSSGTQVLQAPESCRSSRWTELAQLDAGYAIRLHGKRITKTELRKETASVKTR